MHLDFKGRWVSERHDQREDRMKAKKERVKLIQLLVDYVNWNKAD